MEKNINTIEYWNEKFIERWDQNAGREQTAFFTEVLIAALPGEIINEIITNNYSIADVSCGEGDSLYILRDMFLNNTLKGYDFSEKAIENAKSEYMDYEYAVADIFQKQYEEEILICSNTLEHFDEPQKALQNLIKSNPKYLIVAVPFMEGIINNFIEPEHATVFTNDNIPNSIEGYKLIFYKVINLVNVSHTYWPGYQLVLIYAPENHSSEKVELDAETVLISLKNEPLCRLNQLSSKLHKFLNVHSKINVLQKKILEQQKVYIQLVMRNSENEEKMQMEINEIKEQRDKLSNEFKISKEKENELRKQNLELIQNLDSANKDRNGLQCDKNELQHQLNLTRQHVYNIEISAGYRVLQKLYKTIRKRKVLRGLAKTAKRVLFKVAGSNKKTAEVQPMVIVENKEINTVSMSDYVRNVVNNYTGEFVYILTSPCDFNIPLFQRPQQTALSIARTGNLFFYSSYNYYDQVSVGKEIEKNCYVLDATNQLEEVIDVIGECGKKAVWMLYSTDPFTELDIVLKIKKKAFRIIYDYVDEMDESISSMKIPDAVWKRHWYMLSNEDIIVTPSAEKLVNDLLKCRKDVNYQLINNGVDLNHFNIEGYKYKPVPDEIKDIVDAKKPIIGYFGAIASWFDFDLIKYAAEQRPDYNFLLIGPKLHANITTEMLDDLKNVHLIGTIDYKILPEYACWFDVATIPFVLNNVTESTSPIKLFEYMALGKPIVTTNMPECRKYKSVAIAYDQADFVSKIDKALDLGKNAQYLETLGQEAEQNSWDHKAIEFVRVVEQSRKKEKDVIILSIIDWYSRYQRPQHISAGIARTGGRVFYINSAFLDEEVHSYVHGIHCITLKTVPGNIYTLEDEDRINKLSQSMIQFVDKNCITDAVVIVEYPTWQPVVSALKEKFDFQIVYDYLDDFDGFTNTNTNPLLKIGHTKLLEQSNIIFPSSKYLFDKASIKNSNCHMVRNGTEFDHFNQAYIPEKRVEGRPIIGYYGAIADWFDDQIVHYAAQKYPEYDFILIGDYTYGNVTELKMLPNVSFLGEKNYNELPEYLKKFDVALIPFNANLELIKATNPVKFYEYLAAGKKIVATEIPELMEYKNKYVLLSNDKKQFAGYIESCIKNTDGLVDEKSRISFAEENDWKNRVQIIKENIFAGQKDYKKVSIIVITYNNLDLNITCINSVLSKTLYPNFELIIVDNASTDETPKYLSKIEKMYDNVKVILNKNNRGFAGGNNDGIAASDGDYIVLLNNDTVVTPCWLNKLVDYLDDPKIGLIGPVTNHAGNEAKIQIDYSDISDADKFAEKRSVEYAGQIFDINILAMFCVMMRRDTLNKVGSLDESFKIGMFEDDDYSERIRKAGLRVVCAKDIYIHHFGMASFSKLSEDEYHEIWEKNKKIYESKHGQWKPGTPSC